MMSNFTYSDSLVHSSIKKSRSKYKGGFKNGKNTSEYNHDYYMKNKEKWKKNDDDENESSNEPYVSDEYKKELEYNSKKNDYTAYRSDERLGQNKTAKSTKTKIKRPYVSDEYKKELEYNSNKNIYPEHKINKRLSQNKTIEETKPKSAKVKTKKPYVSDEYKKELEYNSKKNVYPEAMTRDKTQNSKTETDTKNPGKTLLSSIKEKANTFLKNGSDFIKNVFSSPSNPGKTLLSSIKKMFSPPSYHEKGVSYDSRTANFNKKKMNPVIKFLRDKIGFTQAENALRAHDERNRVYDESYYKIQTNQIHNMSDESIQRMKDRFARYSDAEVRAYKEYYNTPLYAYRKKKREKYWKKHGYPKGYMTSEDQFKAQFRTK